MQFVARGCSEAAGEQVLRATVPISEVAPIPSISSPRAALAAWDVVLPPRAEDADTAQQKLVIVQAWYGEADATKRFAGRGRDVAALLRAKVSADGKELHFNAEKAPLTALLGDPAPGVAKTVAVRYRYGSSGARTFDFATPTAANERTALHITAAGAGTEPVPLAAQAAQPGAYLCKRAAAASDGAGLVIGASGDVEVSDAAARGTFVVPVGRSTSAEAVAAAVTAVERLWGSVTTVAASKEIALPPSGAEGSGSATEPQQSVCMLCKARCLGGSALLLDGPAFAAPTELRQVRLVNEPFKSAAANLISGIDCASSGSAASVFVAGSTDASAEGDAALPSVDELTSVMAALPEDDPEQAHLHELISRALQRDKRAAAALDGAAVGGAGSASRAPIAAAAASAPPVAVVPPIASLSPVPAHMPVAAAAQLMRDNMLPITMAASAARCGSAEAALAWAREMVKQPSAPKEGGSELKPSAFKTIAGGAVCLSDCATLAFGPCSLDAARWGAMQLLTPLLTRGRWYFEVHTPPSYTTTQQWCCGIANESALIGEHVDVGIATGSWGFDGPAVELLVGGVRSSFGKPRLYGAGTIGIALDLEAGAMYLSHSGDWNSPGSGLAAHNLDGPRGGLDFTKGVRPVFSAPLGCRLYIRTGGTGEHALKYAVPIGYRPLWQAMPDEHLLRPKPLGLASYDVVSLPEALQLPLLHEPVQALPRGVTPVTLLRGPHHGIVLTDEGAAFTFAGGPGVTEALGWHGLSACHLSGDSVLAEGKFVTAHLVDVSGASTAGATPATSLLAAAPAQTVRVVQAALGHAHSLFLTDGGILLACGRNDHGQLGNGTAVGSVCWLPQPVRFPIAPADADGNLRDRLALTSVTDTSGPPPRIVAIAAAQDFSAAVDSSGYAWVWGAAPCFEAVSAREGSAAQFVGAVGVGSSSAAPLPALVEPLCLRMLKPSACSIRPRFRRVYASPGVVVFSPQPHLPAALQWPTAGAASAQTLLTSATAALTARSEVHLADADHCTHDLLCTWQFRSPSPAPFAGALSLTHTLWLPASAPTVARDIVVAGDVIGGSSSGCAWAVDPGLDIWQCRSDNDAATSLRICRWQRKPDFPAVLDGAEAGEEAWPMQLLGAVQLGRLQAARDAAAVGALQLEHLVSIVDACKATSILAAARICAEHDGHIYIEAEAAAAAADVLEASIAHLAAAIDAPALAPEAAISDVSTVLHLAPILRSKEHIARAVAAVERALMRVLPVQDARQSGAAAATPAPDEATAALRSVGHSLLCRALQAAFVALRQHEFAALLPVLRQLEAAATSGIAALPPVSRSCSNPPAACSSSAVVPVAPSADCTHAHGAEVRSILSHISCTAALRQLQRMHARLDALAVAAAGEYSVASLAACLEVQPSELAHALQQLLLATAAAPQAVASVATPVPAVSPTAKAVVSESAQHLRELANAAACVVLAILERAFAIPSGGGASRADEPHIAFLALFGSGSKSSTAAQQGAAEAVRGVTGLLTVLVDTVSAARADSAVPAHLPLPMDTMTRL